MFTVACGGLQLWPLNSGLQPVGSSSRIRDGTRAPCIGSVDCRPLGCGGLIAQSCPTALRPHGVQPARLLCPWGLSKPESCSGLPFLSSRGSSGPRDQTCISCLAGGFFTTESLSPWTTREASSAVTSAAKDALCACRVHIVIILHRRIGSHPKMWAPRRDERSLSHTKTIQKGL